jgi:hypothetical protein
MRLDRGVRSAQSSPRLLKKKRSLAITPSDSVGRRVLDGNGEGHFPYSGVGEGEVR